jgi:hypothetical protein
MRRCRSDGRSTPADVERAFPELTGELKALREELSNLRKTAEGQSAEPSIEPSNFFAKLFKSRQKRV